MMNEAIDRAARELVVARTERRPIQRLSESCRPRSEEDGLAVQKRILELLRDDIGGWKCALPRGENLFLAPLPASTIRRASPCPAMPHAGEAQFEPEIAFILGRDLTPEKSAFTEREVREAVAEARFVLEIIGSRYVDPSVVSYPEFLADSINNQGLFVGPPLPNVFDRELESLKITVSGAAGPLLTHDGRHPNAHPLKPLVWLANFLSERGETLKKGFVVTAGSYAGVLKAPFGIPLSVSYGDLGELHVTFERA